MVHAPGINLQYLKNLFICSLTNPLRCFNSGPIEASKDFLVNHSTDLPRNLKQQLFSLSKGMSPPSPLAQLFNVVADKEELSEIHHKFYITN